MITTESHSYIELLKTFPPRPIKSEPDLLAVQKVIDELIDSGEITPEQQDYITAVCEQIHLK